MAHHTICNVSLCRRHGRAAYIDTLILVNKNLNLVAITNMSGTCHQLDVSSCPNDVRTVVRKWSYLPMYESPHVEYALRFV